MSRKEVTVNDILESHKKYGYKVLVADLDNYKDLKQKDKKAKFDCTYIPLKFKMASGAEVPLRLKFNKVLTASGAKVSKAAVEIKHLFVGFKNIEIEEVKKGDNAPKKKESKEEQIIEDERANKNIKELYENTRNFNKAMEIIGLSYQHCCDTLKEAKTLPFTLRKDKKFDKKIDGTQEQFNKLTHVYKLRQTTRTDSENDEDIELEDPITRIKLLADKDSGLIGVNAWSSTTKKSVFTPNVYDTRKMVKENNWSPVLAKVKVNGKYRPLDVNTAQLFITYKSTVSGIIEFKEITSSKFGISMNNHFVELYVKKHKSTSATPSFTKEELQNIADDNDDNDGSDTELDNVVGELESDLDELEVEEETDEEL